MSQRKKHITWAKLWYIDLISRSWNWLKNSKKSWVNPFTLWWNFSTPIFDLNFSLKCLKSRQKHINCDKLSYYDLISRSWNWWKSRQKPCTFWWKFSTPIFHVNFDLKSLKGKSIFPRLNFHLLTYFRDHEIGGKIVKNHGLTP